MEVIPVGYVPRLAAVHDLPFHSVSDHSVFLDASLATELIEDSEVEPRFLQS